MSWIQTYTGKQFWPLEARMDDVDIRDIAHSLSLQCRFNGHCLTFYSVAEHSVRVCDSLEEPYKLWGLLHDAAEAYLGDLTRPVKHKADWFSRAEDALLQVIARRFGLAWPMPDPVRRADDLLLVTEARDLMAEPPEPWGFSIKPLGERITPLPAEKAEAAFLDRYHTLTHA